MRPILVCLTGLIALAAVVVSQGACANNKEVVQAADAPIGIETSQMFVTVQNRAGTPLLDLSVTIQTPSAPYTYLISRLEGGQKREVPLSSFSSRDGTPFNLRMIRPRGVRATAKDLTNKRYEGQTGWH